MSSKLKFIAALIATLVVGLVLGRFIFSGNSADNHDHPAAADSSLAASPTSWTCSMHPQIQQPGPGKCPICGMDLIPLESGNASGDHGPRAMVMSPSAIALADIQTTIAEQRFPEATVRLVGQLDYDETRLRSLTARFPARIDQLFVNYTGVAVAKGEHLARIYSPELITAQRELLSAHTANPNSVISRVARDKLRLWDLLPEQIDAILARGTIADSFELRAPSGGVVVLKNVKEGDYVKTGEALFRIADLSELWLHLQAFESDLAKLRFGQTVEFTVEAWPGETFSGRIAFIAPDVDQRTRTVPIRVNVPNLHGRLKPGMFARGKVRVKLANENQVFASDLVGKWISPMHPEIIKDAPGLCDVCGMDLVPAESLGYSNAITGKPPVVVPNSAILRTGKRAVIYVRQPGDKESVFEGREVILGAQAGNDVIIASGLAAGEEVVTHGAFKIDSSLQILAKPSMMNPSGGSPPPGHNHGPAPASPAATNHQGHATETVLVIEPALVPQLLPRYLELQSALADDDLAAAQTALKAMMAVTGHAGPLPDLLHTVMGAGNLDIMRGSVFAKISDALITVISAHPDLLETSVARMHCPMAMSGEGGDWLQTSDQLKNPYFGADMLTCGTLVERLK
jgi:Cu(I)/Ag(I) efflux system membrane fusion protein